MISFLYLVLRFILASNVLTVPPHSASSVISSPISSANDTSSKIDLLTIEEIDEIFKKQINKLEELSTIEVNILGKLKRFYFKIKLFFFF